MGLACGSSGDSDGDAGSGDATRGGTSGDDTRGTSVSSGEGPLDDTMGDTAADDGTTGPGDTADDDDDAESEGSGSDTGGEPGEVGLEGYGTLSPFGEGGEVCTVTTLDDAGPGTLRDCIEGRDTTDDSPTPRRIVFEVGGTIVPQADLRIRQPFLTVDGLSAPAPGITIEKEGDGTVGQFVINTWPPNDTCGHDVLVQGIRFRGVWPGDTEEHSQNAGTIAIDGEDLPLCLRNVVINRVTVIDAQDSGGDIWGSAQDVTVQYSAFLRSLHPNTYSHFPGGATDQQRERLSNHHNLYAQIHERGPQVRAVVLDANFEQNIMHDWDAFGFGGGYAMRVRCREGFCPDRINVIANHFTSGSESLDAGFVLGDVVGPGDDADVAPGVYMSDNRLPARNVDMGVAAAAFPRSPEAEVTIVPPGDLVSDVLPNIGAPHRTDEEVAIFDEVATQIEADLPG